MIDKTELKQAWRHRHCHLSETQEQLRRAAFGLVRAGCAATEAQLAQRVQLPHNRVREELRTLEQQGLIVCDTTSVVGIYGLSLVTTPHQLNLDGQPLFTWCALDAVGIAAGLAANAVVQASCFRCGEALTIPFRAGQVGAVSTAEVCIWLTPPGQGASAVADT
ncbi:organomercurial lyase [Candidatus Entotheonella palauensis]|uniref:organomercurial lyase n=1 Tax=Candidatus Entotheonella palauensis TaxID=93172 RepID=UPI000B7FEC4D|nr:organomercurial lyase [Candidatus Entotheonella palauensis]